MDPSEKIIADALLSGDFAQGIRRVTCNIAASTRMYCECGDVLDQHTVSVIENDKGTTIGACCPKCIDKYRERLAALPDWKITTWEN